MFSCLSPDGDDKDDGRYARSRSHRLGEHRPINPRQQTGLQPPESDASRLQPQFAEQLPRHYSRLAAATRLPVAGSFKALSAWSTWNTSQDPPAQRCWPTGADQSKPSRRSASSSSPTPSSSAQSGKGTGCFLLLDTQMPLENSLNVLEHVHVRQSVYGLRISNCSACNLPCPVINLRSFIHDGQPSVARMSRLASNLPRSWKISAAAVQQPHEVWHFLPTRLLRCSLF